MKLTYNLQKASLRFALDRLLKYIDKDPQANIVKLSQKIEPVFNKIFPPENFKKFQEVAKDKDNVWTQFALSILNDVDRDLVKSMLISLGIHAGYYGTKTVRAKRDKYNCNIPFIILFDPTSACNLKCKGCWAAEYGHNFQLSLDDMRNIVNQGKDLGTHFYMLTGGEPLIRKNDIVKLVEEFPGYSLVKKNSQLGWIKNEYLGDKNEIK